jgi:hypothetical protein
MKVARDVQAQGLPKPQDVQCRGGQVAFFQKLHPEEHAAEIVVAGGLAGKFRDVGGN